MKTYKIPVVWQMYGCMQIEADSLEDAIKQAMGDESLPDGEYVDESCELDHAEVVASLNKHLTEEEEDWLGNYQENK